MTAEELEAAKAEERRLNPMLVLRAPSIPEEERVELLRIIRETVGHAFPCPNGATIELIEAKQ